MTTIQTEETPQTNLNQGQKHAADAFFTFLFGTEKEFIISGPAGVGKTLLMGHIIDIIMPQYIETCKIMGIEPEYNEVVMTATTNKAAEVLGLSTGRPAETIHSFMNLKVQDDFSTGRSKLIKTSAWYVHQAKIIFIDEASMIDSDLYAILQEGTHQCKIVYVGDHCQLAPVAETISPVYKTNAPFYTLTEIMRTKNPDIQAINQQLRETVETGVFKPIKIIPGVIDLLSDEEMEMGIAHMFTEQTLDSRILAFTNKRVIQYNDHIRDIRQLPDAYTIGELLINTNSIQLNKSRLSVEEEVEIISIDVGSEMIVIDKNVNLEIRRATIKTRLGAVFTNVPLPADRKHFTELVQYFKSMKNWNRYFHLKNNYPDLRQRDAATLHKAQGSTYKYVFIDLGNVSTCNIAHLVARLLYVGFSRAQERIFLYGDLAEKYGGLIH